MMDKKRIEELAAQHAGGVLISRYAVGEMIQALRGRSGKVAEGWKLVPVEPTRAMIDAAERTVPDVFSIGDEYRAMVKAAPAADSAATEQAKLPQNFNDVRLLPLGQPAERAAEPKQYIPANFTTHRNAWRDAIVAQINAHTSDDKAYWEHELAAYDRSFARLLDNPEPVRAAAPASADVGELPKDDGRITATMADVLERLSNFPFTHQKMAQGPLEQIQSEADRILKQYRASKEAPK